MGSDAGEIIHKIDSHDRIEWHPNDIQEKLNNVLARRSDIHPEAAFETLSCSTLATATNRSCYLCGRRTVHYKRDAPFNEFYSVVVDELGSGIHMVAHWYD